MRHVRPCTPYTSACFAAIAVAATCGTASAQALFTTLHSAKATLNSFGGSPSSSYWTYTGPTNNTGGPVAMTSFAQPNTGDASVGLVRNFVWDELSMTWFNNPGSSFSVRFEWDATFSSVAGGVTLAMNFMNGYGTLTVKPLGGSVAGLAEGDILANGRYTFAWEVAETIPYPGVSNGIRFIEASVAGGGAVPLPGAAGLAAIGLVGLSRRRRR